MNVRKLEKIVEMDIWLNPKYLIKIDNQQVRFIYYLKNVIILQ